MWPKTFLKLHVRLQFARMTGRLHKLLLIEVIWSLDLEGNPKKLAVQACNRFGFNYVLGCLALAILKLILVLLDYVQNSGCSQCISSDAISHSRNACHLSA